MFWRTIRAIVIFAGGALAGISWAHKPPPLPVTRAEASEPVKQTLPTGRDIATRSLAATVYLHGGNVYGAGVLLDEEGHVLTCDHVIDGLDHVEASFDDETPRPIRVVARAKDVDLALLALDAVPEGRAPLASAKAAALSMGDTVYAMGAPRKMRFSLSRGVVSYASRTIDGMSYVQTDLAANGGSSGGPVMNERGELVGVSSFILRGAEGLTFAVPIDYAYERFGAQLTAARSCSGGRC